MKEESKNIEGWLIQIGITPNLVGFTYLREAVELYVDIIGKTCQITKIYNILAKIHGKTVSAVERGIRHAIKVASDSNKLIKLNNVIGHVVLNGYDKPSSGVLISLLAQKYRTLYV